MHPRHYRIRILLDILRGIVLPAVAVSLVTSYFNVRLGYTTIPCWTFAVALWAGTRILWSEMIQQREAKRLGARPIPRVIGKWPGNIDVLFKMMRSFKTSYLVNTYLDLFDEYKATTLNLRILWEDQVGDGFAELNRACV